DYYEALKVVDHNGDSLFTIKMVREELNLSTTSLTNQQIANIEFTNYYDTPYIISSFELHHPLNPWRGWPASRYNFSFKLTNPTFIVNRPNCIAVRVVWEEDNPDIDYSAEGIEIIGGQAIAGPNATNPVFYQADKRDNTAADIPITFRNTTYEGFTERIVRSNYTPMNIILENNMYCIASGGWDDPGIWSSSQGGLPGSSVPNPYSQVFIDGFVVSILKDTKCKKLVLGNEQQEALLQISNGLLSVSGEIQIPNSHPSNQDSKIEVSGNGAIIVLPVQ
ncbi:MAG: hypothetical protein KAI99_10060, partial [Cyclobacteriaceae bacterium]|nr:hypothetical protein [Cyclobacteriaceae bacterium]